MTKAKDAEKTIIINLYAAFGVGLALSIIPNILASIVAFIFIAGVLVASYRLRKKYELGTLVENHAQYIISTFGSASIFALISFVFGAAYLYSEASYDAFLPCQNALLSRGMEFAQNATNQQIIELASPCMDQFWQDNFNTLMITGVIGAMPVLLYLSYKYTKGLTRAIKRYRIAEPRAWF